MTHCCLYVWPELCPLLLCLLLWGQKGQGFISLPDSPLYLPPPKEALALSSFLGPSNKGQATGAPAK